MSKGIEQKLNGWINTGNSNRYDQKYVAFALETGNVVASGNSPIEARDEAIRKGTKNPGIFYVIPQEQGFSYVSMAA